MHRVRAWGAGTRLAPNPGNKTAQESLQNRGDRAAIAARLCWVGPKAGRGFSHQLRGGQVGCCHWAHAFPTTHFWPQICSLNPPPTAQPAAKVKG